MPTQQVFAFDASEDVLAKIRIAVDAIGLKGAAAECDMSPSGLGDALAERDRKGLRVRPLLALLRALSNDQREPILRAIVEPFGFELKERQPLTPAEQLADLRAALRQLAPGVLNMYDAGRR